MCFDLAFGVLGAHALTTEYSRHKVSHRRRKYDARECVAGL